MGELVHHGQLRATVQNRRDVQLRKARALIGDHAGGKHFEIGELSSGRRPPVTLPMGDDGVGAGASPGACVPQHRVGLPHSGGNPEVDAQLAPAGGRHHRVMCRSLSDPVRAVLTAGPGAAGHRWIHSAGVSESGPGHRGSRHSHRRPEPGRAAVRAGPPVAVPIQTPSARNDTRQRSPANRRPGPEHKLLFCTPRTRAMLSSQNLAAKGLRSALACSLNPPADARRSSSTGPPGTRQNSLICLGAGAARCRAQSRAYRLQRRSRRPCFAAHP